LGTELENRKNLSVNIMYETECSWSDGYLGGIGFRFLIGGRILWIFH